MNHLKITCSTSLGTVLSFTCSLLIYSAPLTASAQAEQPEKGFYFSAGGGAALAEDVDVESFPGLGSGDVELDTGVHLGVSGGYNFNRWIGAEIETGYIGNEIDKISSVAADGTLSHVPFLAKVILRYQDPDFPVVPYIGLGAGGDSSIIYLDRSLGLDGSDADLVYAFQGTVGLHYKINDSMSAGAEYKFYRTGEPSWDVDGAVADVEFGEAQTHSFMAVFNMKF